MHKFNFSESLINSFYSALSLYKSDKNVFGIDIGKRYKNGVRTEEICVRVHLVIDTNFASSDTQITFIAYPNVRTQFMRKVIPRTSNRTRRLQIIQPGVSIGRSNPGTLGLICFDKLNGLNPCLLTAGHVFQGGVGNNVSQPGPGLDGGHLLFDAVGRILRSDNFGDAAIATFNRNRGFRLEQFETNNIIDSIRQVNIGDVLIKSGRTTGITSAEVDGIGVYFNDSSYYRKEIQGFKLVPQDDMNSENVEISDNGDSGSVWFDARTNEGVGLLFAGENSRIAPHQEFCLAQHLTDVFDRLQIAINNMIN